MLASVMSRHSGTIYSNRIGSLNPEKRELEAYIQVIGKVKSRADWIRDIGLFGVCCMTNLQLQLVHIGWEPLLFNYLDNVTLTKICSQKPLKGVCDPAISL